MTEEDLKIIDYYNLSAHPEGGWFQKNLHCSQDSVRLKRGERLCEFIYYYFLGAGESSSLHSFDSDETWYFHFGSPVTLHLFSRN